MVSSDNLMWIDTFLNHAILVAYCFGKLHWTRQDKTSPTLKKAHIFASLSKVEYLTQEKKES